VKQPATHRKAIAAAISVALTWDGARSSLRALPPAARKFLAANPAPAARKTAQLFAGETVREIRVCWVPQLRGGDDVLCPPFSTGNGKRLAFRAAKTQRFGDVLGVIYRRA
jgi:hypothetical protein